MSVEKVTPEEGILTHPGPTFSSIRFCLSDKISKSLDSVVFGKDSVKDYVRHVFKNDRHSFYDYIKDFSFEKDPEFPQDIKEAWIYDRFLETAQFYRISHVRKRKLEDVISVIYPILAYGLVITDKRLSVSAYSGLMEFKTLMEGFITFLEEKLPEDHHKTFIRLVNAISDLDESDWIFHDPVWYKTFSKYEERLIILRGFLFVCMASMCTDDNSIKNIFSVDRKTIIDDMEYFIDLRNDPATERKDILEFLRHVEYYSTDVAEHQLMSSSYNDMFGNFKEIHQAVYGNTFNAPEEMVLSDIVDKPIWEYLRSLSPELSPESVITTPKTPFQLAQEYLTKYPEEISTKAMELMQDRLGGELPDVSPLTDLYVKGLLLDLLIFSFAERRFQEASTNSPEEIANIVAAKFHIALIIIDDGLELCGLSFASQMLGHYVSFNEEQLTDEESNTVVDLCYALDACGICDPDNMSLPWKENVFDKPFVRRFIREFLFTVSEIVSAHATLDMIASTGVSREQFFERINVFTELLRDEADEEELLEFLSTAPKLTAFVSTNEWTRRIFRAPFDIIKEAMPGSPPVNSNQDDEDDES